MNNDSFQSVIDTFDVLVGAVRDTIVMSIISLVIAGVIAWRSASRCTPPVRATCSAAGPPTRCSTWW